MVDRVPVSSGTDATGSGHLPNFAAGRISGWTLKKKWKAASKRW